MSQAPLAPVSLPTDIDLVQTVDREMLRAKLRARTNALASGRLRKYTNASDKLAQAAQQAGAPSESASASALLHSTSAEKLAEMIQTALRSGQIPDNLRGLIPHEARNLSKKDLIKLIRTLYSK